ncbi:MAG: hypothetical protein AAGD35_01285 [Actinomycetota bacterium]
MSLTSLLLFAHIFSAVLMIGPLTVASGAFGRFVKAAHDDPAALGAAKELGRISNNYGSASALVGGIGVVLATDTGWWPALWLQVATAVFVAGYVTLVVSVLPLQRRLLAEVEDGGSVDPELIGKLHRTTGVYSLSWVAVLALMVLKPW